MEDAANPRERARALHREGRLLEARAAYEALIAREPGDPELLGLLGVVALQRGETGEAERLLRMSLARTPTGRAGTLVHLRNLNNFIVLLRESELEDEARELLAGAVPDWPAGAPATGAERNVALSLTEALIVYGQPGKARQLLDAAFPERAGDAALLNLDGRLRIEEGEPAEAAAVLTRAAELAPGEWQPMVGLAVAQGQLGDHEAERATLRRVAERWPVYSAPEIPGQGARILVLNPVPTTVKERNAGLRRVHFPGNYATEVAGTLHKEYRFHSLLVGEGELPATLPEVDIVLNNMVNSESLNVPGRLAQVRAAVARVGRPVINDPEQVFATTRQKNAMVLEGVPNLRLPRIERYRVGDAPVAAIVADITGTFGYPVIIRKTSAHESTDSLLVDTGDKVALLVHDAATLGTHLERYGWQEFYAIEYVDLRRDDGFYRKIRAIFVEDEMTINTVGMNREWMVSGWRAKPIGIDFYRSQPQAQAECVAIVSNPEAELGKAVLDTVRDIRRRIRLDMFGIDFDVDREGRVVFFEASAAMIFYAENMAAPPDIRLPDEPYRRIDDAFRRLVAKRIAEGRTGRP